MRLLKLEYTMVSRQKLTRNITLALIIVVVLVTGIFYITQTNNHSATLTRINEIALNSFTVAEDVCVYNDEVYVAGWEYNNESQPVSHARLSKLTYDGEVIWETSWDSAGDERARKVSCNGDGVFVVGKAVDESGQSMGYIARFGFDGVRVWTLNGSVGGVFAMEDYVYVKMDGFLVKLDGEGKVIWERPAQGGSIFVEGNVIYVAGSTAVNASGGSDSVVTSFDTDGNQLWSSRRESTKGDVLWDICATDDGVYIVGGGTKGWSYRYITKFSLTGEQLWNKQLTKTVNGTLVTLCSINGEIYAAGALGDTPKKLDAITSKIDEDGYIEAIDIYDGFGEEDYAYDVYSVESKIYVVGTSVERSVENPIPTRRGMLLIYNKR